MTSSLQKVSKTMIALVQKENNLIHVLTLFLGKVYHAPDVQNILQKPVVWGHHFIIEEVFLLLQWDYSLTPFLAAALHLSHTPVLWDQQIRYLPGYVGGNLMLLTSSSCGFWLRPCLRTHQSPLAHPASFWGGFANSPSVENTVF